MRDKIKIALYYIGFIEAILFLAIMVDYVPHAVAWAHSLAMFYLVFQCKPFRNHIINWLDQVIPID